MQLGTTAEGLEEVTGTSSTSPATQSSADDTPQQNHVTQHHAAESEREDPSAETERPISTTLKKPKLRPPEIPAAVRVDSVQRAQKAAAQRDSDFTLGAPLLPEHASDPHYYPGISDEPPPIELVPIEAPKHWKRLIMCGIAAGLLLLVLIVRSAVSGSSPTTLVVDVTPSDAKVTLDGEPLSAASGPRSRAGLMNGEHVLAAERSGFVSQRRVFTYDAAQGDRRMVLTLEPEPPPPTAAEPAIAKAAEPALETAPAAAEPADQDPLGTQGGERKSARERRLERRRARLAAMAAARESSGASGRAATSTEPKASKGGAPGTLKLNSVPWAEVYIDKKHVRYTPLIGLARRPARHLIKLTNRSSRATKTLRIKIAPGETVTQVVKL